MPKQIIGAKIACIDFNLNKMKLHHGVKLTLTDPTQINAIQQREMDITKERVQMILNAGANVILTSKGIDSTSMKYFVEAGVMAVRRVTKHDLRQIAKATGGLFSILTLSQLSPLYPFVFFVLKLTP
jgi:T-complex protein 1 subunit alpha